MLKFAHDIAGGQGNLIASSIQSPNFDLADPSASPEHSWALLRSGLAYLFGLVINGGTINGSDYVINPDGIFFYSSDGGGYLLAEGGDGSILLEDGAVLVAEGAPITSGDLIMSMTEAGGVDEYGNAYQAGFTVYGTGGSYMNLGLFGTDPIIVMDPANPLGSGYIPPQIETAYFGTATAGFFELDIESGSPTTGTPNAKLILFSGSEDGTTSVAHMGVYGGSAGDLLVDVNENGITAANPVTPNTTETWHTITLDSGWSLNEAYAAPSYRLLPDGNLQLTGLADFGSLATSNENLNSSNPLPAAYRPKTTKVFRSFSGPGARGAVQISDNGVIAMLANSTYPAEYCEIDAVLPLNL